MFRALRFLIIGALRRLPKNNFCDKVFCFSYFIYAHRRIPRRSSGLFNDYLYFLKTSNLMYDPLRQITSDKIYVKLFVEAVLGEATTVKTYKVYENLDTLKNDLIPESSVLKPAHATGIVYPSLTASGQIDQRTFDATEKLFERDLYGLAREKNYRYVRKRIISEKALSDSSSMKDYKVFCFQGKPRAVQVDSDRFSNHKRNMYDVAWNQLDISYNFPIGKWEEKPRKLEAMLSYSEKIAKHFESVRVDFFIVDNEIYIGELTHCPESAHGRFGSLSEERVFSDLYFGRA